MFSAKTFDISMQNLVDMTIVQACKQLPHVTLEQGISSGIKPWHIQSKALPVTWIGGYTLICGTVNRIPGRSASPVRSWSIYSKTM